MKNLYTKIKVLTLTCLVFLLLVHNYWTPDEITTGWPKSTPEEQGMDSELLVDALNLLAEQEDYEVHSLLIIRNGLRSVKKGDGRSVFNAIKDASLCNPLISFLLLQEIVRGAE